MSDKLQLRVWKGVLSGRIFAGWCRETGRFVDGHPVLEVVGDKWDVTDDVEAAVAQTDGQTVSG